MLTQTTSDSTDDRQRTLLGIAWWIPLAAAVTVLSLFMYGLVQQDLRQSANDPQIQMAEDTAYQLSLGRSPQSLVPADKVDMARSLAPFVIIYDDTGQVLASSAELHGQAPILPRTVLDSVRSHDEDRFTWQPEPHIRSAVVVTRYSDLQSGFVLAGRSLREVEQRETRLRTIGTVGLFASLIATFAAVMAVTMLGNRLRS